VCVHLPLQPRLQWPVKERERDDIFQRVDGWWRFGLSSSLSFSTLFKKETLTQLVVPGEVRAGAAVPGAYASGGGEEEREREECVRERKKSRLRRSRLPPLVSLFSQFAALTLLADDAVAILGGNAVIQGGVPEPKKGGRGRVEKERKGGVG
jgi:hypothetical protein